ncbi:MAG TPA: hypothetical protein VLA33_02565 [Gemmatimonadota bacterium]|nr:hypothetical protein [Gemmatimonadota bacterium]
MMQNITLPLPDDPRHLLGTETNVRILRVLTRTEVPLGKSEVARWAGVA